jgi:hypothetical protein
VKTILNGAGSLSLTLLETVKDMFPAARILSAYGEPSSDPRFNFACIRLNHPSAKILKQKDL